MINGKNVSNVPCAFIVEEAICSLFVFLSDVLGFFVSLEPGLVLLVEAPTLALQCLCSQELLVSALAVVEGVEQCIRLNSAVQSWVVKHGQRLLGVVSRCVSIW